jgi:urocanate hydratase
VSRRGGVLVAVAATVAATAALFPGVAHACQACFGAADGPMIEGARAGGWALIGLAAVMQGAFATFFLILRRRLKQAAAAPAAPGGRAAHS